MAGDLTKFNEFMTQFMPLLLRGQMDEKRVQLYLDRTLKEMGERGRIREEGAQADQARKIMLQLIESVQAGTGGLDRPGAATLQRLEEIGITHPSIPTIRGETYGQLTAPFERTGAMLTERLEETQFPSKDEISSSIRNFGYDKTAKWLNELVKKETAEETRAVTITGQEITRDRLSLDEKKFKRQKEQDLLGAGPKGKKKDQDLLLLLTKEESTLNAQLSDLVTDQFADEYEESKVAPIEKRLEEIRKQKLNLIEKMKSDLMSTTRLNEILAKLKSGGVTVEGMEKYKKRFMEEENLTEVEYQYLKVMISK